MILGPAPNYAQQAQDQPIYGPQTPRSSLVAALMGGMTGSPPASASAFNIGPADVLKLSQFLKGDPNSPLLGGAQAGMPNFVNAARFALSGAGGVNPYTYGMGSTGPGGAVGNAIDTAGNLQV
jgi:hypothetical protein